MILITTVAGVIGRFAGRVLNSALGWATVLLFGKVAQSRQILLLLDGSFAVVLLHRDPSYMETAGQAAHALVEACLPRPKSRRAR